MQSNSKIHLCIISRMEPLWWRERNDAPCRRGVKFWVVDVALVGLLTLKPCMRKSYNRWKDDKTEDSRSTTCLLYKARASVTDSFKTASIIAIEI